MSGKSGRINGYNIRTEKGMRVMLEAVAEGYEGYDGTPFNLSLFDYDRCHVGLYLIEEREIQLVVIPEIGNLMLMECALHELAHHIDTCINGGVCGFHSRQFYRIYFNLYKRAEELGFLKYDDVSNDFRPEADGPARPYDVQMLERYYGRPDGKPVDRNLLKKEMEARGKSRREKAARVRQERERAKRELEKERAEEREMKNLLKKQEEENRIFREVFGWM